MRVLISGSTGLVGSTLVKALKAHGDEPLRLVRRPAGSAEPEILWTPENGPQAPAALEGVDAVVHLAGESIAGGRWTEAKKRRIRDSRVNGTRALAQSVARSSRPPKVFISASAIGYYGDRGDEILDESSRPGAGFLSDACQEWEASTRPAADAGARVAHLRFGVILSRHGGALPQMLLPFRLGAGGRLGDGRQFMSWIELDDAVAALRHALANDLRGPVNVVSPQPVRNSEFTSAVGRVLHRPTLFPFPRPVARVVLGEMADALLFASARVMPGKLTSAGFSFRHPSIEEALRHALQ